MYLQQFGATYLFVHKSFANLFSLSPGATAVAERSGYWMLSTSIPGYTRPPNFATCSSVLLTCPGVQEFRQSLSEYSMRLSGFVIALVYTYA